MVGRWVIRVAMLVMLAFVVGVWGVSCFGGVSVRVDGRGRMWVVNGVQGEAGFLIVPAGNLKPNVYCRFQRQTTARDWKMDVRFPGFRYGDYDGIADSHFFVFPMWLPTGVVAGMSWWVWRRTRGKGEGRGFPVEVGKRRGMAAEG